MKYRRFTQFLHRAFVLSLLSFPLWAHDGPHGTDVVKLVDELGPSVVAIHVTMENVRMSPGAGPQEQQGGGSGFVVDQEGRIATNFHVVAPALEEENVYEGELTLRPSASIAVTFVDEPEKEYSARVLGANADYDLALLELTDEDRPQVPPLKLGNSDTVKAGEDAIAIGAPFGLQSTVTTGIVSAIEREQPGLVGIEIPFIQSDAAINPGNSGGPLFNGQGEVIGINNAILASPMGPGAFVGVGFAVPVNLLKQSMGELVEGGLSGVVAAIADMPDRPRLGLTVPLSVEDYPPELREAIGLPDSGVAVGDVEPGSPAEEAGLQGATGAVFAGGTAFPTGGDFIIEANGKEIQRPIHLQQVILDTKEGEEVELSVWRDGEVREVEVELEVISPQPAAQPTSLDSLDQAQSPALPFTVGQN